MPSKTRRYSRQKLLCMYLLLAHACIVYICVWHSSRQRRKTHARWRGLPPPAAPRALVRHPREDKATNNHSCAQVQAAIFIANYTDPGTRLRALASNRQSLTFLQQTLSHWESTTDHRHQNVAFILLRNMDIWPSACTDMRAPVSSTCIIHPLPPDTHSKLDVLHWLQQKSLTNDTCVIWNTVVLLQTPENTGAPGANSEHEVIFDSGIFARMHAAPASRATCLQKKEVKRQEQSCLVSVWKAR